MKNRLFIAFCLFIFTTVALAATHRVPKNYATIQQAISAATDGDVVLVGEGRYYENINFMGKKIVVASYFYKDHNRRHIRKTIIDGSRPADPNFGSVVSFVSGEDTNSVLCGFTITGGTGLLNIMPDTPPIRMGGGVLCWVLIPIETPQKIRFKTPHIFF